MCEVILVVSGCRNHLSQYCISFLLMYAKTVQNKNPMLHVQMDFDIHLSKNIPVNIKPVSCIFHSLFVSFRPTCTSDLDFGLRGSLFASNISFPKEPLISERFLFRTCNQYDPYCYVVICIKLLQSISTRIYVSNYLNSISVVRSISGSTTRRSSK
jgi:hypothetical protein